MTRGVFTFIKRVGKSVTGQATGKQNGYKCKEYISQVSYLLIAKDIYYLGKDNRLHICNMARINIIHPKYLTDQHLIAEHREINLAVSMIRKITNKNIPEYFTLNKGHVLFFSNKVAYLKERYAVVGKEMDKRGFKSNTRFMGEDLIMGSKPYKLRQADVEIIVERIISKIKLRPNWYRYKGKPIDDKEYIKWLKTLL